MSWPHPAGMVSTARPIGRQLDITLGSELRDARRAHGLSQRLVARAAGTSQTKLSRIERGAVHGASLAQLSAIARFVGLRLVLRCYPAGNALRDKAQVALLNELRLSIHRSLRWRTEVPLPIPGDLRAVDAIISGLGFTVLVEAWTRLTDLQAQTRAAQLKRRDFGGGRLVMLIADTHLNRQTLSSVRPGLDDDFPLGARAVLTALRAGRDPGADGIVILRARRASAPLNSRVMTRNANATPSPSRFQVPGA